jgi:hypothetical protein
MKRLVAAPVFGGNPLVPRAWRGRLFHRLTMQQTPQTTTDPGATRTTMGGMHSQ